MSDNGAPHPSLGSEQKSRPPRPPRSSESGYASWRKKFRKMRVDYDVVLEENKRLFKEEQKLAGLARRLTEELDGLMDILLDLNQSSALPPNLRFDVALPDSQRPFRDIPPPSVLPDTVTPEHANEIMREYIGAVQSGRLPTFDLHVMRDHIQERLAKQDIQELPRPEPGLDITEYAKENNPEGHPSFLSGEREDAYLRRLDLAVMDPLRATTEVPHASHQADLTPRELERQMELMNPQSQYNWLRSHSKVHHTDDDDPLAEPTTKSAARKRQSGGKSLARQVMTDQMAREAFSPSDMSGIGEDEAEEGASRKRGGDTDPPFRGKGTRGGGSTKAKRKRTTDEGSAAGAKRIRASEIIE